MPKGPGYHEFKQIEVFGEDRNFTRFGLRWEGYYGSNTKTTWQAVGVNGLAGDGDDNDRPVNSLLFLSFCFCFHINCNVFLF